jgi:predicted aspartyl protease
MKLEVGLGSASLVALLDSGSTHNFISEVAARRLGLPLQHRPRLTAMVANGERVACVGVIRCAPLTIGGASFPADLYVIPLAGYDVVLGTQWLAVLGPIVWDFGNRAVSFTYQGRTFCWQGLPSP